MWRSIAITLSVLVTHVAMRSIVIDIKTFDIEFNRDVVQNATVSLITVDKRRVFNGSIIPQIDVPSFDLTATLTTKNRTATYFNLKLKGCEFIAPPFLNPMSLSGAITNTIRHSIQNLPKRCPIKKFTEVIISNLYIDTDLMPFALVQGPFEFTLTVTVESALGFRMMVDGVLGPKRKRSG